MLVVVKASPARGICGMACYCTESREEELGHLRHRGRGHLAADGCRSTELTPAGDAYATKAAKKKRV